MKIKLIEQVSKKEIGQLNWNYTPRKGEFIEFENKIYCINYVLYSKNNINLNVFETNL